MKPLRLVVVGTMASNPYAGMAWMNMQITAGLRRLGHDAYYFEVTSSWPYDPVRGSPVCDSDYAAKYLADVAGQFGLAGKWAYRRSYSDGEWLGLSKTQAEGLLAGADAVFNVAGATDLAHEGLRVGRLVYYGTDPVGHEIAYAKGDPDVRAFIDAHDDVVTFGENIGRPGCPIPPLPRLRAYTRQPVLLDRWESGPPTHEAFTTVGNWRQEGDDFDWQGDTYYWSKHHEFLKFIDLPTRVSQPIELATGVHSLRPEERALLTRNRWRLVDAHPLTTAPWPYRDYVRSSKGEFTVAKDQNVRLKSGWFSERSACYLAAGRPVVTQDTAFGAALPTGEGLFAFNTTDEILAAFDAIQTDYPRHCRAARRLAQEFFRAETVLSKLLADLGL